MTHVIIPGGFACGAAPSGSETLDSTLNVMASTCPKCVHAVLSGALSSLLPERSRSERSPEPGSCAWRPNEDSVWATGCGRSFQFTDGAGPVEHGFQFCPFCGSGVNDRRQAVPGPT